MALPRGSRGFVFGSPVRQSEEDFRALGSMLDRREQLTRNMVHLGIASVGCNGRPAVNLMDGHDCEASADGQLVMVTRQNGVSSLLTRDVAEPYTSNGLLLPQSVYSQTVQVGPPPVVEEPAALVLRFIDSAGNKYDENGAWISKNATPLPTVEGRYRVRVSNLVDGTWAAPQFHEAEIIRLTDSQTWEISDAAAGTGYWSVINGVVGGSTQWLEGDTLPFDFARRGVGSESHLVLGIGSRITSGFGCGGSGVSIGYKGVSYFLLNEASAMAPVADPDTGAGGCFAAQTNGYGHIAPDPVNGGWWVFSPGRGPASGEPIPQGFQRVTYSGSGTLLVYGPYTEFSDPGGNADSNGDMPTPGIVHPVYE